METHLHREVEQLKTRVLEVGGMVEESLQKAILAISRRDAVLAEQVVQGDEEVDRMEVDVEEDCLQILALYQPVASDLRFIVAVLKLNNDLERIGDLAVNIAQRVKNLGEFPPVEMPFDFRRMAEKVQQMLKGALDALVNLDPQLAREICAADQEIDAIHRTVYQGVYDGIRKNPDQMQPLIATLTVARHLERIADHATNIAEDVIYTVEGQITRHKILNERPGR
ncbi:MAG: phosphate signaling complex protein PhoU [Candidatus Eisenbacteria bacterium]